MAERRAVDQRFPLVIIGRSFLLPEPCEGYSSFEVPFFTKRCAFNPLAEYSMNITVPAVQTSARALLQYAAADDGDEGKQVSYGRS